MVELAAAMAAAIMVNTTIINLETIKINIKTLDARDFFSVRNFLLCHKFQVSSARKILKVYKSVKRRRNTSKNITCF